MTALKKFERLESGGLWRASPDAQRRDVTVSFGKATLVITDNAGRALTHWSLPAVIRTNPGTRPALFAPDEDGSEELEIEDDTMIDAIESVRKALIRSRPHPGKLRHLSTFGIIAALVAVGLIWGPSTLTRQTLSVVPLSKRAEIGATVLGHYQRVTGATCRGAAGTQALAHLKTRLLGRDAAGQFVVVQSLPQGAVTLPGGITMIDRRLVEQHDDVSIPAGYVVAANSDRARHDPLRAILDHAGLQTTFTLLTTGDIPNDALAAYAESIAAGAVSNTPTADILTGFADAKLTTVPYATVLETDPETRNALINGDPMAETDMPLILEDRDWVRLQGICS